MGIDLSSDNGAADRDERIARLAAQVLSDRSDGHGLSDDELIASHPELMPDLRERLRVLRLIDEAQHRASGSQDTVPSTGFMAIPGYSLLREVHRGGQGVVFEAVQQSTGRRVAIKVLRDSAFAGLHDRARFEQEVRILGGLDHPNIVTIRDSGHVADNAFFIMEFIDGLPVDAYQSTHRVSPRQMLELFARICEAVNAAHLRGVIHRDLKPGNILIDERGEPHILDFGLAKLVFDRVEHVGSEAGNPGMTMTGQFVGSLPWASPEQAEGLQHLVDVRTDVYSLGVILYQLLTDRFPYEVSGAIRQVLDNIATAEPPRPGSMNPHVDDEIDTITLKCLHKEPVRRYQGAGELAGDIRHYLRDEPIEAKRDNGWYVLRKLLKRHRLAVMIVSAFVFITGISAVSLAVMYARQSRLFTEVGREADKAQRVERFLGDILASFNPEFARGRDAGMLREMLDRAAARVDAELEGQPEVEAAVRDTLGRAYNRLELLDQAQHQHEQALAIRKRLHGEMHLDVAVSLSHLAEVLMDRSEYKIAEPLYRQALAIRQSLLPAEHVDVAAAMNDLALARASLGDYAGAEELYRKALDMYRRLSGPGHADVARTLSLLGMMMYSKEDYPAAEPLLRSAREIDLNLHGPDHLETAADSVNLAKLLHMQGEYVEAAAMLRQAISTYRTLLGGEHSNVAWALHRLGTVLHSQGEYDEAVGVLREALELRRRILPQNDPYTAWTLNSLGNLLMDRGDLLAAEDAFVEAAAIWQKRLPPEDPYRVWSFNRIGELLQQEGDFDTAESLLRAALTERDRCGTQEHPDLIRTLNSLAALLLTKGETNEAVSLFREALSRAQNVYGSEHPDVAAGLSNLGWAQHVAGDEASAEPLLRNGLAMARKLLGDSHPIVALCSQHLAALLHAQAQDVEALPLCADALRIRQAFFPSEHSLIEESRALLDAIRTTED